MGILNRFKKAVNDYIEMNKLERMDALVGELDDELDTLASKIYLIRKTSHRYLDRAELESDKKQSKIVSDFAQEIFEIIGNSPRSISQLPN